MGGKIPAETASFRSTTVSPVREDWMVGTTGIAPVAPSMSTQCVDGNNTEITVCRRVRLPKRSRSDHGNFGHILGAPPLLPDIHPDEDGSYSIGLSGPAFPTRRFAESVRLRGTRNFDIWLRQ